MHNISTIAALANVCERTAVIKTGETGAGSLSPFLPSGRQGDGSSASFFLSCKAHRKLNCDVENVVRQLMD